MHAICTYIKHYHYFGKRFMFSSVPRMYASLYFFRSQLIDQDRTAMVRNVWDTDDDGWRSVCNWRG